MQIFLVLIEFKNNNIENIHTLEQTIIKSTFIENLIKLYITTERNKNKDIAPVK